MEYDEEVEGERMLHNTCDDDFVLWCYNSFHFVVVLMPISCHFQDCKALLFTSLLM